MDPGLLPATYKPVLSRKEVAVASDAVKQMFEERLRSDLNMFKHSAPSAFVHGTGVTASSFSLCLESSLRHAACLLSTDTVFGRWP